MFLFVIELAIEKRTPCIFTIHAENNIFGTYMSIPKDVVNPISMTSDIYVKMLIVFELLITMLF
jgi:hypothetical protein